MRSLESDKLILRERAWTSRANISRYILKFSLNYIHYIARKHRHLQPRRKKTKCTDSNAVRAKKKNERKKDDIRVQNPLADPTKGREVRQRRGRRRRALASTPDLSSRCELLYVRERTSASSYLLPTYTILPSIPCRCLNPVELNFHAEHASGTRKSDLRENPASSRIRQILDPNSLHPLCVSIVRDNNAS